MIATVDDPSARGTRVSALINRGAKGQRLASSRRSVRADTATAGLSVLSKTSLRVVGKVIAGITGGLAFVAAFCFFDVGSSYL